MSCVMRYNYYYFGYYHIYIIIFFKAIFSCFSGYLMGKKVFFYLLIYIDCVIVSSKNKLNSHKLRLNQLKMHRSRHRFEVVAVIPCLLEYTG